MTDIEAQQTTRWGRAIEIALLVFVAGHVAAHGYHVVARVSLAERIPWLLLVAIFFSITLLTALYALGWKRALTFLGITVVISYLCEFVGMHTGWIFGNYVYTDVLEPKLPGGIPLVIPPTYFMLMVSGYLITNFVLCGKAVLDYRHGVSVPAAALLTGGIVTAFDLSYDPMMADGYKAWIWLDGGDYFGIPFHNYAGWLFTTTTIALIYRYAETRIEPKPLGDSKWVCLVAVACYAVLGLGDVLTGYPKATRLLAAFAILGPILASMICRRQHSDQESAARSL